MIFIIVVFIPHHHITINVGDVLTDSLMAGPVMLFLLFVVCGKELLIFVHLEVIFIHLFLLTVIFLIIIIVDLLMILLLDIRLVLELLHELLLKIIVIIVVNHHILLLLLLLLVVLLLVITTKLIIIVFFELELRLWLLFSGTSVIRVASLLPLLLRTGGRRIIIHW